MGDLLERLSKPKRPIETESEEEEREEALGGGGGGAMRAEREEESETEREREPLLDQASSVLMESTIVQSVWRQQIQCFDKRLVPGGHTFCGECAAALEAGFVAIGN